jgi:hypothetical protein
MSYLVQYDEKLSLIELEKKEKILSKKLKSKTGWRKVETGGDLPYPCPNCRDWNSEYRRKVACNVCKDNRWLIKHIPLTWHDNNGDNTTQFNVKQISTIKSDYYYSNLEISEWPFFWTTTSPGTDSYQKPDDRYSKIYGFMGDKFYLSSSRKYSLLQIRCIKNSSEESDIETNSTKKENNGKYTKNLFNENWSTSFHKTIEPTSSKETIKPFYDKNDEDNEDEYKKLPPLQNTCNFPFKLGCISNEIREIQTCLKKMNMHINTNGVYDRITWKDLSDRSFFADDNPDNEMITKEMYDRFM